MRTDSQARELAELAHLRRAKDLMDREFEHPLDVPRMAHEALMSPAHFSRRFRAAFDGGRPCHPRRAPCRCQTR